MSTSASVPSTGERSTVPRGSSPWPAAGVNQMPPPGASEAAARGAESITASAPQAIAVATSPPQCNGPSATTWT